MMQLFTALSFLNISMPENVLMIQQGYTDIIDLNFVSKDVVDKIFGIEQSEA